MSSSRNWLLLWESFFLWSLIVRRLVDQKSNLFLLHNKKTLCQISQLPSQLDNRLVYYSEWANGSSDTQHGKRASVWRSNINRFCSKYLTDHADDFLDAPKTSALKEYTAKGWKPTIGQFERLQSVLFKSLSMHQKTENEAFLQHAIDEVEDALGKKKQNVGGSQSMRTPPPVPIGNSNRDVVILLEHLLKVRETQTKSFEAWMRGELEMLSGKQDENGVMDGSTIVAKELHTLAQTTDLATTRNRIGHLISQQIHLRYQSSMGGLMGIIKAEMDSFRDIIHGLGHVGKGEN
ncbi:hypothetical protein BKA56DRAFT_667276 [Ilyonectria sp. MPI-CAGE-AT-0026]|nr:hypothetical protein BKA56DRAFT_667276 [Ilyonectria sp. MPI-CAGE-AT-0026]